MNQKPKLLIVDDEIVTRKGLINNVPWSALGIDEIREAENGQQAMDMLDVYEPDIILTDIRMPLMNGIELATQVVERMPGCKIIFLSGFSDKEYLKAAIHLGVIDYVEKPIDVQELSAAIRKTVDLYWSEIKRPIGMLDDGMVKKGLIDKIIRHHSDVSKLVPVFEGVGVSINGTTSVFMVIVKISRQLKEIQAVEVFGIIDRQILAVYGEGNFIGSVKDPNHLVWLVKGSCDRDIRKVSQVIEVMEQIYAEMNQYIFYSVSSIEQGIEKAYKAYQNSVITLQSLFINGYGQIAYYDGKRMSETCLPDSDVVLNRYKNYLREKDYDKVIPFVERWAKGVRFQQGVMVNDIKNTFFQMILLLVNHAQGEVSYNNRQEADEPYLWECIFRTETLEELKSILIKKCNAVFKAVDMSEAYSKATREVISIINESYMDSELSTKVLAEAVYLTTSYLSGLFKKETGTNISKYIRTVRIEASRELLRDTRLQLREVAQSIGYSDANYYAKIFRKEVGISPSEYRERQLS